MADTGKENYEVNSYGNMIEASSTAKTMSGNLETIKGTVDEVKNTLSNQSIFMGPAADRCVKDVQSLITKIDAYIADFNTVSSYLTQAQEEYKSGDSSASNKVLKISEDGKVEITTETANSSSTSSTTGLDGISKYKNPANKTGFRLDFINEVLPGAISTYKKYGVLPSVTLAQAICESNWGQQRIDNNIFGIKAGSSWKGKTKTTGTHEYRNGKSVAIRDTFRAYDTAQESIEDHGRLLAELSRYKPVISAKTYKEQCTQLQKCGYATSPTYAKTLIDIIEYNGLDQWDNI